MKRFIFWLLTAFLTFVISASAATIIYLKYFRFQPSLPEISLPEEQADRSESNPLTFCELANNPEKYDGQTVRLEAVYHLGIEGSWFSDERCGADNGAIVSAENKDVWKVIEKARANKQGEPSDVELNLVVVGKFKNVAYQDWCCLTAPFQFEISKIEQASKIR